MDESNWYASGRVFVEVTVVGMSGTRSEQNYSYKPDFETRREKQDLGRQNISMIRQPLDWTPFGTNTANGTTSPIESIPARTKTSDPTLLTRPTEYSTRSTESVDTPLSYTCKYRSFLPTITQCRIFVPTITQ